jgi:D-erythronate 2-dehydrogenase
MKIVITGGGGFLGAKLAKALLARKDVTRLTLADRAFPADLPRDARLEALAGDVSDAGFVARAIAPDTDSVFHLAAVVSGAAEADFDLGLRVNLGGTRAVLEQARLVFESGARPPKVVFASSVAAFGGELPAVLDDSTMPVPQTSYGTQKVIGEYLVADYSRKGYIDGRSLRLPTIVVRPGKPNAAASSFASAVVREPLNGVPYECPLPPETAVWLLSPRRAVEAFMHALELSAPAWPASRAVNLPGITATVGEMIAAMTRVAGPAPAQRITFKVDPRIDAIVRTWPVRFATPRALAMGFAPDPDIETVIRDYIADEGVRPR